MQIWGINSGSEKAITWEIGKQEVFLRLMDWVITSLFENKVFT